MTLFSSKYSVLFLLSSIRLRVYRASLRRLYGSVSQSQDILTKTLHLHLLFTIKRFNAHLYHQSLHAHDSYIHFNSQKRYLTLSLARRPLKKKANSDHDTFNSALRAIKFCATSRPSGHSQHNISQLHEPAHTHK